MGIVVEQVLCSTWIAVTGNWPHFQPLASLAANSVKTGANDIVTTGNK